jgi:hypothetical protein
VVTTQIDLDAATLLGLLATAPRDEYVDRDDVAARSGLTPERINDAVALLVDSGYAEWIQTFGTHPYNFNAVMITSRGRYESQRLSTAKAREAAAEPARNADAAEERGDSVRAVALPPSPIGSPYGFTDEDWETVSERKHQSHTLYAVLGHQFSSQHFHTDTLRANIESMMRRAIEAYNASPGRSQLSLEFSALSAGYGEHLFNEIARDIIGCDIAIFETSDLNPNVMLEMGVALTWGVRVLPIKVEGRPKPPSDVSGQTWADYTDNAATFSDPEHQRKLVRMIERAVRKKGRETV